MSGRFLSERLKKYLDENTSLVIINPLSCFLESAIACVGIEEEGGDNCGPMVEAFQATIGGLHKQSWCLSFIQALTAYTEDRMGVKSNLPLTELVADLWDKAPMDSKFTLQDPGPGDLILWRYGETEKGHCGIIMKSSYKVIETIEGNTSNNLEIDRNGDGVYKKIRAKVGTTNMHVLGFIRPQYA